MIQIAQIRYCKDTKGHRLNNDTGDTDQAMTQEDTDQVMTQRAQIR